MIHTVRITNPDSGERLSVHFMVQRRRRLYKQSSPTTYHYRKLFGFAGGVVVLVIVLWFVYLTSSSDSVEATNEADVPAGPVIVEVLNGTHVSGIAAQMSRFLQENDFDSLITGNAAGPTIPESIIFERLREPSDRIIELTGIRNRTFAIDSGSTTAVKIILGADYELFYPFKQ